MARRSGRGKTPDNVVKLLKEATSSESQSALSKALGVDAATISRYVHGVGEPTQETMERISAYFQVGEDWLRSGESSFEEAKRTYNMKGFEFLESFSNLDDLDDEERKIMGEALHTQLGCISEDLRTYLFAYLKLPLNQRNEAIIMASRMKKYRLSPDDEITLQLSTSEFGSVKVIPEKE